MDKRQVAKPAKSHQQGLRTHLGTATQMSTHLAGLLIPGRQHGWEVTGKATLDPAVKE